MVWLRTRNWWPPHVWCRERLYRSSTGAFHWRRERLYRTSTPPTKSDFHSPYELIQGPPNEGFPLQGPTDSSWASGSAPQNLKQTRPKQTSPTSPKDGEPLPDSCAFFLHDGTPSPRLDQRADTGKSTVRVHTPLFPIHCPQNKESYLHPFIYIFICICSPRIASPSSLPSRPPTAHLYPLENRRHCLREWREGGQKTGFGWESRVGSLQRRT